MRLVGGHGKPRHSDWVQGALEAVRDEDAATVAPPELYHDVMRAWDGRCRRRMLRRTATLSCAAAAIVGVAAWWVSSTTRSGLAVHSNSAPAPDSLPGQDSVLATEVFIDDASSMQYVRLSVTPQAMAAFGIPLAGAADGSPVAVEALIGLDGIPRAIRYAHAGQEPQ